MVNESASKIKQDNTTQMILVNRYNKQGNFQGWSSLSYTPIKAYCTAVLGCWDWLRSEAKGRRIGIQYCTIGLFQIVMLSNISIAISLVWRSGVLCTKGLECGSNRRIILGGAVFDDEAFCTGLLGCTAYGGLFHWRYKKLSWLGCYFRVIYCGTVYKDNSLIY